MCPTDWLGFVQESESEGKGDEYTLSNCVRVALEPPANVSSTRHQLFSHPTHARTHTECDKYEGAQRVLTAKESLDC